MSENIRKNIKILSLSTLLLGAGFLCFLLANQKEAKASSVVLDNYTLNYCKENNIDPNSLSIYKRDPAGIQYRIGNANQILAIFSSIPEYDYDGNPINTSFNKIKENTFENNANLFKTLVEDKKVTIWHKNQVAIWNPQLFLDGKEVKSNQAGLLEIDPANENYQKNTLEWDYGICKRRLRIIEGAILEVYIFGKNPEGDVVIKSNWQGDIKPAGYYAVDNQGNPLEFKVVGDEKRIPAKSFENAIYPVEIDDSATFSGGINYDGWVANSNPSYAVAHDAVSGVVQLDGPIFVGQVLSGNYTIYRGGLYFNTEILPDNANISAATLSFYQPSAWNWSVKDFYITVVDGSSLDFPMSTSDYGDLRSQTVSGGSINTSVFTGDGYYDINLNSTGIGWISKKETTPGTGYTKLGLRSDYDISSTPPIVNNNEYVAFYSSQDAYPPKLTVTYTYVNSPPALSSVSLTPPQPCWGPIFYSTASDSDGDALKLYICKDSSCTNCDITNTVNCWAVTTGDGVVTNPTAMNYYCPYCTYSVNNYWAKVCDPKVCSGIIPTSGSYSFTCKKQSSCPETVAANCCSGIVADNYCCDVSCSGTCQTCASNPGTCTTRSANDNTECAVGYRCDGSSVNCVAVPTPAVVTNIATINREALTATLNGQLTDMGGAASVTVWFRWGQTAAYGNTTSSAQMSSPGPFYTVIDISPNTVYHFEAVAESSGISYGGDRKIVSFIDADIQEPFTTSTSDTTPPAVSVIAFDDGNQVNPTTTWRNISLRAEVSCTDASGCDSGSYKLKTYTSNPGTCSTNYSDYILTSPQVVSSYVWVCGAAKDLATPKNAGFSSPVEFKIDKVKPSTAVTDPADGSWQKDDFIVTIDDSDAGDSGLAAECQYHIADLDTGNTTGTLSRSCDPVTKNVPVGTGEICSSQGRGKCKVSTKSFDVAGNDSGWKSSNFSIDYTPPNVGKISCANLPGEVCYPGSPCLTAEQGIEKSFCATLTDPVGKVTGCWLYVDGEFKKAGTVSPIPCQDGAACGVSVNYAFSVAGSHTMRFSCKDAAGNYGWGESVTVNVTANHPPQITDGPRYITSPCTGPTTQPGCMVNFRVTAIDEDGDVLSYSWLFGDGGSSGSQNPAHHYDSPNTYPATVTVSDGRGGVVTAGVSVPVTDPTLSVNLLAEPAFGTGSLSGVKLRAIVVGSMSGSINYYFDSNLANGDCTADANYSDCDHQALNQSTLNYLTPSLVSYSVGTFTAKVLVERGTGSASGTAEIKVIATVCTPGQTTTCTSSQGCSHTITCQAGGTWPACPSDQCPKGLSMSCGSCGTQTCLDTCVWGTCSGQGACSPGPDSSNCPCPPDKCVGADYYDYPAFGDCTASCYCNSGTASGQPCYPTITPNDEAHCAATLSVDLKLATDSTNWQDNLTGSAPLSGVDIRAAVSGTITGTINYKIDCQNDGVWENEINNTAINPYIVDNLCNFSQAKTHTVRVKIERGTKTAEDVATVFAYSNPPNAQIGCDSSQCGLGSSCGPDIAYNRNCQFSYLNQSTDPDNDITRTVWSIFYGSCPSTNPWADPFLSCSGLCNLTLPSLPTGQSYCLKLYVEDNTGNSDSATRTFYVRREAIADFDCSLNPEAEEAWQSCDNFIVNEGVVVYFLDKSSASEGSGGIVRREWTFKDGTPNQNIDNETNPFSSFQEVDRNSGKVTLEIEDDVGRKDTTFHQVLPTIPLPEWKEVPPIESYTPPSCYTNGTSCSAGGDCCSTYCFIDADGDGYVGTSGSKTCQVSASLGSDCYDANANAKPGQTSWYKVVRGDESFDYNCDSSETKLYNPVSTLPAAGCYETKPSGTGGWSGAVPNCGVSSTYTSCSSYSDSGCVTHLTSGGFGSCPSSGVSWKVSDPVSLQQSCH